MKRLKIQVPFTVLYSIESFPDFRDIGASVEHAEIFIDNFPALLRYIGFA
jgi:hypothetical protein